MIEDVEDLARGHEEESRPSGTNSTAKEEAQ